MTSHLEVTKPIQDVYAGKCPARELLDRIADKWTTLIIGILAEHPGPLRFGDMRRQITGISQKMLTQTLRDLERDGLVVRRAYPVIPPRVEYSAHGARQKRSRIRCARSPSGPSHTWTKCAPHKSFSTRSDWSSRKRSENT